MTFYIIVNLKSFKRDGVVDPNKKYHFETCLSFCPVCKDAFLFTFQKNEDIIPVLYLK